MHTKKTIFDAAVDITKEYIRGGGENNVASTFEEIHTTLKKVAEAEQIIMHR